MGAWPSNAHATSSPWSCLTQKLLHHVLRRLSSEADRLRFAAVCRNVAGQLMSGWSALPPAIADLVVRCLSASADRIRFATVCRLWRRVASQFSSPWSSDFPPELASLVLHRLNRSYADRARFAAVCRHWRYVARQYSPPPPPALPWLCSRYGFCWSLSNGKMHVLRSSSRGRDELCYGSFGDWLLFRGIGHNESFFVENPHSKSVLGLPTHCQEPVSVYIDGSYYRPSKNSRSASFDIHKIIECTGEIIVGLVRYTRIKSKVVVCCRKGMSSWSTGLHHVNHQNQDMALHMGKLYAAANGGQLFAHEVTVDGHTGEPMVSRIEQVIPAPPELDGFYRVLDSTTRCYLVHSLSGKLLLVIWYIPFSFNIMEPGKDLKVKVFEADFESSLWVEVERLDDQVLFVSSRCSKAMSASNDDEEYLQANKIYIVEKNIMSLYFRENRDTCTCVYDMCRKIIHPISLGEEMIIQSEAAWFFP